MPQKEIPDVENGLGANQEGHAPKSKRKFWDVPKEKPSAEEKPLFTDTKWHGKVPGFRCVTCGHFEPKRDDIVLHVLNHLPSDQREATMERLVKNG